jgi:hypothetical protein
MKRTVLSILAMLALVAVPAAALAKGGHHGRHHHHNRLVVNPGANAGTVKAFDATTGDLTITTAKGRDITAAVTDATEIECEGADDSTASTSSHGNDDNGGDDNGGDDHSGDDNGDDDGANHDAGDDNGNDDSSCTTADLTAGAAVRKARIDLSGDDAVWSKVELVG